MRIPKLIILISSVIILASCTSNKYLLTISKDDINSTNTRPYNNNGTYFIGEEVTTKNKVILLPAKFKNETLFKKAIEFTKEKKLTKLLTYLDKSENGIYHPFIYGIYYLYKKDYTRAIECFKQNKCEDINFIAELLIIDCKCEKSMASYHGANYNQYLQMYQDYLDTHDLSKEYKEIVKNRIRFLRYNI